MRVYLYILAGITSALIGWNLGQFFLTDLGLLKQFPEIVLFPCIAISLAIGMVLNEIFISNPTRPKLNLRIALIPITLAAGLGLLAGLIAGGISQILFLPQIRVPTPIVRTLGWLFIGSSIGIAEGWTWRWRSIEAGDKKRFRQRFRISVLGASAASLVAALIFELLRQQMGEFPPELKGVEDPLGFSILGMLLGLVFSITASPSYMVALRAGKGFEYTGPKFQDSYGAENTTPTNNYPQIETPLLKFVSDSYSDEIEEGLSIQLPNKGKIKIGSAPKANIRIPGIPLHLADLELKPRETLLVPNQQYYYLIEVNGQHLNSRQPKPLKHNYVLTFHSKGEYGDEEKKIFRFVYYNRFLDPQA